MCCIYIILVHIVNQVLDMSKRESMPTLIYSLFFDNQIYCYMSVNLTN